MCWEVCLYHLLAISSQHITSHHITSHWTNTPHIYTHNCMKTPYSVVLMTTTPLYQDTVHSCIDTSCPFVSTHLISFLFPSNPPYAILFTLSHLCSDISHSSGPTGSPRPYKRCPSQHSQSSQIPRYNSLSYTVSIHPSNLLFQYILPIHPLVVLNTCTLLIPILTMTLTMYL